MTADPLLDPTDVDAAVDSFRIPFDLAATGTGGFTVGMVTAAVVYAAYPPVHTRGPIIIAGVASVLLIAVLYLALARVARLRAADWLIVGYVVALVGVTGLVMAVEGMQFLRDHVPSHLGVTVATVARPRAAG
ncbi:MAG: hypothetical protein E6J56_18060 [Deltaproteobacteria bacterium]|nr:MAG: hypothetical protein E6J56_18060 [Deltaproteobacteria bacterium]